MSTHFTQNGEVGPNLDLSNEAHNSPTGYVGGLRISQIPHKLVVPEKSTLNAFYIVLIEMDPKVVKRVHLAYKLGLEDT